MPKLRGKYVKRWADISACGRYRWLLGRQWSADETLPWMHFVMLNPSTADAELDDPTITRCVGFAQREGCGGLLVTNLSSYRATKPQELLRWVKPCAPKWGVRTNSWGESKEGWAQDDAWGDLTNHYIRAAAHDEHGSTLSRGARTPDTACSGTGQRKCSICSTAAVVVRSAR